MIANVWTHRSYHSLITLTLLVGSSEDNLFKIVSFHIIYDINLYFFFQILDLFDHKSRGLFSILNDECKFKSPSTQNFASNLKNAWEKPGTLITWNFCGQKSETTFVIRHFSSDVRYSTVILYNILQNA